MLPESQQIFQVKVVKTFLLASASWMSSGSFLKRQVIDSLTDALFILEEEETNIKCEIKGKHIGVMFNGMTRLGEAMATVVRFVSESWELEQHLVHVQLHADVQVTIPTSLPLYLIMGVK